MDKRLEIHLSLKTHKLVSVCQKHKPEKSTYFRLGAKPRLLSFAKADSSTGWKPRLWSEPTPEGVDTKNYSKKELKNLGQFQKLFVKTAMI